MKIMTPAFSRYGFSLIEVLITFVLLGLMTALLVPQYLNLQRQATVRTAIQQTDAIKKAIMAWSTSTSDLNTLAGANGYGATVNPTATAFTAICKYLDDASVSNIVLINGNPVTYIQTTEMQSLIPSANPAVFNAVPATVFGAAAPAKVIATAAHAVIYWPTGTTRRSTQPTVILYYPN